MNASALPAAQGSATPHASRWAQLGLHAKPCGLLDVDGYFGDLLRFLDGAVTHQFLKRANRARVLVAEDAWTPLDRLEAQAPSAVTQWIETDVT